MYKWTKMIDVPNDLPMYDRAQFQIGTDIYLIGGNGFFLGNWNDTPQYKPTEYSTACYKFDCLTETFSEITPIPDNCGHGQMFAFTIDGIGYVGGGLISGVSGGSNVDVTSSAYAISNYPLGWGGDGTYSIDLVFDKDSNTYWHTNNPDGGTNSPGGAPWWIGQDFGEGNEKTIIIYSIQIRPEYAGQYPSSWTFEASNTGTWTGEEVILDTQIGITWTTGSELKSFNIINTTPYRYYRINVTESDVSEYLAIAEINMYEYQEVAYYGISDKVWLYNPGIDTWTELNPFGGGERRGATAFAINGKGYVSNGARLWELPNDGEQASRHVHYTWDVWEYDPTGDSWTDKTLTMAYSGSQFAEQYMRSTNLTTHAATGERGRAYVVDDAYAIIHGGLVRGSNGDLYPLASCWSYHPDINTTLWEGQWRSGSREGYWQEAMVKMGGELLYTSLYPSDSVNMYFPHYILGPTEVISCEYIPWLQVEEGQYSFASPNAWNNGDDAYILDVGVLYKYSYISNVPLYYNNIRRNR